MSVEDGNPGQNAFKASDMLREHMSRGRQNETEGDHAKVMELLGKYLELVPVGQGGHYRRLDPKLRMSLFQERGHVCEACSRDLSQSRFDVHHTNYNKGDDPKYLRILCKPCHKIVGYLTGAVSWFAKESGLEKPVPSQTTGDYPPVQRKVMWRIIDPAEWPKDWGPQPGRETGK